MVGLAKNINSRYFVQLYDSVKSKLRISNEISSLVTYFTNVSVSIINKDDTEIYVKQCLRW